MKRRTFLGSIAMGTAASLAGLNLWQRELIRQRSELSRSAMASEVAAPEAVLGSTPEVSLPISAVVEEAPATSQEMTQAVERVLTASPERAEYLALFEAKPALPSVADEAELATYLDKMENFEHSHQQDVFISEQENALLVESFKRIDRVQTLVGHGNFNVLSFDAMLKYAKHHSVVGAFETAELDFLEGLFFDDVERYGFFGEKVVDSLTAVINERDRSKIPYTGHFLFKGKSQEMYKKIQADCGDSVVLTSGIRGIVKQTHLFLAKTIQSEGNLSLASRSLAPPGHSFHGIGDFDVGKVGYGAKNFTAEFSYTAEYRNLVDLGYLDMRYPEQNLLGVRFEPWHIKVA